MGVKLLFLSGYAKISLLKQRRGVLLVKLNRELTLGILCLFLFAIMILIVDGSNVLYSATASVSVASANKLKENEDIDISDIAIDVSDRIDDTSISMIATNIERIEVYNELIKNAPVGEHFL